MQKGRTIVGAVARRLNAKFIIFKCKIHHFQFKIRSLNGPWRFERSPAVDQAALRTPAGLQVTINHSETPPENQDAVRIACVVTVWHPVFVLRFELATDL